jgi:hypothetical protein
MPGSKDWKQALLQSVKAAKKISRGSLNPKILFNIRVKNDWS